MVSVTGPLLYRLLLAFESKLQPIWDCWLPMFPHERMGYKSWSCMLVCRPYIYMFICLNKPKTCVQPHLPLPFKVAWPELRRWTKMLVDHDLTRVTFTCPKSRYRITMNRLSLAFVYFITHFTTYQITIPEYLWWCVCVQTYCNVEALYRSMHNCKFSHLPTCPVTTEKLSA